MPRQIPIALQGRLRRDSTSLCTIIRVDPVQPGYASYGAALLDQPLDYDDGLGLLTYQAIIGAQPSALVSGADLSVDGGEAASLLPEFDFPISEADILAGAYDFARFRAYLVDYRDLTAGHIILGTGTLGRVTVNDDGLSFVEELRGLAQNLKQTITEKWSLGCRATFGSQASTPLPPIVPLVNPGFDNDASGWTLSTVGGTMPAWSATGGRTTPGCIRLDTNDALSSGDVLSGFYDINNNRPITVRASLRSAYSAIPLARGRVRITLQWYDAGNVLVSEEPGPLADAAGMADWWFIASVTGRRPAGATKMRIHIHMTKVLVGDMWMDDVSWNYRDGAIPDTSGQAVERYPCNFDATALWEPGTVEAVGLENTIRLVTSGLAPAYGGSPGMLRWVTGPNAGRTYEVDTFTDDDGTQTIDLTFSAMFPIEVGDTFEFRDDCPKTPEACKARGNWQWYRGEPNIPVADAGQSSVPGASAGVSTGGSVNQEFPQEAL